MCSDSVLLLTHVEPLHLIVIHQDGMKERQDLRSQVPFQCVQNNVLRAWPPFVVGYYSQPLAAKQVQ